MEEVQASYSHSLMQSLQRSQLRNSWERRYYLHLEPSLIIENHCRYWRCRLLFQYYCRLREQVGQEHTPFLPMWRCRFPDLVLLLAGIFELGLASDEAVSDYV